MLKRTLIVLCITVAMVAAVEPFQTVHGIIMTQAQWLMMNSSDNQMLSSEAQEGRGNSFLGALKAPFKAIGRLFGGGKKNRVKLERISEKDAQRFESVPGVQTTNTTPAAEVSSNGNTPGSSGMATTGATNSADALDTVALDHLEKGRALLNSNDLNGAIGELSMAASANPKLSEASTLLGVAYWRKGLSDLAQRSFETALRINKDDPQNLNNLGYFLYENGDYENATKYFKRAAKLSPNDPLILNNLALAQSQRGKFDDAYKNFARAGGEITGHVNVANRLEIAGRSEEALKHYEAAKLKAQQSTFGAQDITVAIEVQNGRITYASVTNHRRGMEAYEASAIRLVRERKYPSTRNGQDSVVVRVSPLPAS
ncbi:MAG TPA: tetratricopeptide repeat protein [Pyrinomonadaceae bacterium]|nr:tetratricopeptide repeat protein [Pyrinomonadaceae bacterium]